MQNISVSENFLNTYTRYMKIDKYNEVLTLDLAAHYRDILGKLGEDPERDGLLKTPERVAKALQLDRKSVV